MKPELYEKQFENLLVGLCVLLAANLTKPKKYSKFKGILNLLKHDRNKKNAMILAKLNNTKGNIEEKIGFFRSIDEPLIKGLIRKSLIKVGFKKIIYIQRIPQNKWDSESLSINSEPIGTKNAKKPNPAWKFSPNLKKSAEGIRVRVLAKHPVGLFGAEVEAKKKSGCFSCSSSKSSKGSFRPKRLIYHIHGGGFVAGSSHQLQVFSRV